MARKTLIFQFLLLFAAILTATGTCLYFKKSPFSLQPLISQNTYLGPSNKIPGNPQLVRVQVLINDDPKLGGLEIQSAEFNHMSIPLKPRDVYGFRGEASFQCRPGKYKLKWVVQRDKLVWPRTISHEEVVTIDPRDLWVQISIEGETASIR